MNSLHRRLLNLAVALAFAPTIGVTWSASAKADTGPQQTAVPLELKVTPGLAPPNASVTISGSTPVDGKRFDVKISITPPKLPGLNLVVHAGSSGNFQTVFTKTSTLGDYVVRATSPDGKSSATARFTIADAAHVGDAVGDEQSDLMSAVNGAESAAETLAASLPASPAQAQVVEKLQEAKKRLAEAPKQIAQFKAGWNKLSAVTDKYPQAQDVLTPTVSQLDDWREQAKKEAEQIRKQISHSQARGVKCDQIDALTQMLSYISYGLDFVGKPFAIVRTLIEDKVVPEKLVAKTHDENAKFLFAEAAKAADAIYQGPTAWVGTGIAFFFDIAAFASQKWFGKYCERFQGPMHVTFRAEFYHLGSPYWTYDEDLDGTLNLRYAKPEHAGDAVHFSGEYKGYATKFGLWENFTLFYPNLRGDVLFHKAVPPSGHPSTGEKLGLPTLLPGLSGGLNFEIPVEGDWVKDKLTVHLNNAAQDLDNVKGRVDYVFVAPGAFIPETIRIKTPYQSAYWIISRGIGTHPEFMVSVDREHNVSIIERQFKRTAEGKNPAYIVRFSATVKACNPECP